IKGICFEENDKLNITEYTQAALVTTCLAITNVLMEKGLRPEVTAGLSLGEYAAIYAAGGMDLKDVIKITRKRGILMQEAVPAGQGGMAAILGLSGETIEKVIKEIKGVTIANYNCPGQIVITGLKERIEIANARLMEAGAKRAVLLNVSGPFHSPLLAEAGNELKRAMEDVKVYELKIPYVTNVTGEYVMDIGETKALLGAQVASPVRWQQSVERMIAHGVDTFIEIGPGKTLSGFIKKINREVEVYSVGTMEELESGKVGKLLC
ncbi:MAG: ACP S-malonyltransferase, partial [Acetivibrio sp.]